MQKFKSFILPIALILGYFFRDICSILSVTVPYVIFAILFLTFSGVKLSSLRPKKLDLSLSIFQTLASLLVFWVVLAFSGDEILAQGSMMCILCPVASSVTVVASMLGANAVRTTTYTIIGNLLISIIAPAYITFITDQEGQTLANSYMMIFGKIAVVIALPFIVVWLIQRFLSSFNEIISHYKQFSFYLWAYALLVTIGQTADFVVSRWRESYDNVLWLGVSSLVVCIIQFALGKCIGKRYGDKVAGGQLLAQKNTAMGIWMINTFLNPIASVAMAYYSIWQNIYNSWQLYTNKKS